MTPLRQPTPPKGDCDAADQVAWLRGAIHLYARDLAMLEALDGLDADKATDRLAVACDYFAATIEPRQGVRQAAIFAEQQAAAETLQRCMDELSKRVHVLHRYGEPTHKVMAEAERLCARHGVAVPEDLLVARVGALTHAAAPRRRRYG